MNIKRVIRAKCFVIVEYMDNTIEMYSSLSKIRGNIKEEVNAFMYDRSLSSIKEQPVVGSKVEFVRIYQHLN